MKLNYQEALEYIDSICGLGAKLGLLRIEELLKFLGNPQKDLKVIHVAGTNGKGSVCAMLKSILVEAGYCVGAYTSPHLEQYNERYTINGQEISDEDFAYIITKIAKASEIMEKQGQGRPTVFEVLTAAAFLYFKEKHVDILILEVGLGGRYDATNVIRKPLLSIINSIGMDHMDYLGDSLQGIAKEKGGIIKENCPTVLYNQCQMVYNVIKGICDTVGSKLYFAEDEKITVLSQTLDETIFSIQNQYLKYNDIKLNLIGEYQIKNCATVLLSCMVLQNQGINLTEEIIREGLAKSHWNGRMEIMKRNPLVILDGAHNRDGINMLAASIKKYFSGKDITLLIGVLADKEYNRMAETLLPLVNRAVLTRPNNNRALSAEHLREVAAQFVEVVGADDNISEAYGLALQHTKENGILICAGSLYLIGEVRSIIKE